MASLLERMNVPATTGPVRPKHHAKSTAPYNRANRPPKGDVNSAWSHDLFDQHNSLSARLNLDPTPAKTSFNPMVQKALRDAASSSNSELSIKGAANGNVIEVSGLVQGTTADDVAAIFKRCGDITAKKVMPGSEVKIRLTYKTQAAAEQAVKIFDKQPADGKMLSVRIVGATSTGTSLSGRFGNDGLGLVRQEGSVDVLMESNESGSKMRSDSLTSDPRAQVLVAPPGMDPKGYVQAPRRGGGRGRGGRRGGRGRGNNSHRMNVD